MNPLVQKIVEQASQTLKTLEPLLHLKDQKILEQLKNMGLATREEVENLEKRIEDLERQIQTLKGA